MTTRQLCHQGILHSDAKDGQRWERSISLLHRGKVELGAGSDFGKLGPQGPILPACIYSFAFWVELG